MKTRRTYITPTTKCLSLHTGHLLQDTVIFSGGAPEEGIFIDMESDDSDGANPINGCTNHLWDDYVLLPLPATEIIFNP